MHGWYFAPWTIQYLIAGTIILILSFFVFSKNIRSKAHQFFFFFGMMIFLWQVTVFLHRSAPTPDLSKLFFGMSVFCSLLGQSFLLVTILNVSHGRNIYGLAVLPILPVALAGILLRPFSMIWTDVIGWSYKFTVSFAAIVYVTAFLYTIVIVYFSVKLWKKFPTLRKKYSLILIGWILINTVGMILANIYLHFYPASPPVGGIITMLAFLSIAYAISLPTEKIEVLHINNMKKFSEDYLRFLNKLLDGAPGKELGQNVAELNRFLRVTGLNEVVSLKKEKITLNSDKLNSLDLLESAEKTLEYLEKHDWATEARAHYKDVFIDAYLTTRQKSIKTADEWFKRMLRKHSGFFSTYGIMDAMPEDVELPKGVLDTILKSIKLPDEYRLKGGIIYFIRGDGVEKGYKFFTGLAKYARTLCFTDTNPREVRETYGLEGVSIVWVTFERYAEGKTIPPNKLDELTATISEFFGKGKGVVFVDCIDSMVMANGFKRVMSWLKGVKKIMTKSKSNLLVTIDPTSFSNGQLASIGREMKEIKV